MAANAFHYEDCIAFNGNVLTAAGASEKEIAAIVNDPQNAPLEDNEKAMLTFVTKVIRTPEAVRDEDINALRHLGWKDSDILDAAAHGAFMQGHATLMKAFNRT